MSAAFDALPKVKTCCFCIISLKAACIMICIIELLSAATYYFYGIGCYLNRIQEILIYIIIVCDVVLALSSIVFFIGILFNIQITAVLYMWVMLISVLTKLVASIIGKVAGVIDGTDRYIDYTCHTTESLVLAILNAADMFDALPKVNTCCFCIGLKAACFIICIVEMISFSSYYLYGVGCYYNRIQEILVYLIIICDVVLALSSIVFFIGILLDKQITAIMYMWVMLISVVTKLVASIFGKIIAMFDGYDRYYTCHTALSLSMALINAAVMIYFMIVVRSHKDNMS